MLEGIEMVAGRGLSRGLFYVEPKRDDEILVIAEGNGNDGAVEEAPDTVPGQDDKAEIEGCGDDVGELSEASTSDFPDLVGDTSNVVRDMMDDYEYANPSWRKLAAIC